MPTSNASVFVDEPTVLQRLTSRQLTRGHVSLTERPQAIEAARRALELAEVAWSNLLPIPLGIRARLLDAGYLPQEGLALHSAFAVLELSAVGARAVLEVDLTFVAGALELLSGEPGAGTTAFELTRAEQAAFAYLLLVGLSAARGEPMCERLWSPRLLSIHGTKRDALLHLEHDTHVGVDVALTAGDLRGSARLLLSARALHASLLPLPLGEGEAAAEVLAVTLPFTPIIGRASVGSDEPLGLGDVVLLEAVSWSLGSARGVARLRGARFELEGELSAGSFTYRAARLCPPEPEFHVSPPEVTVVQNISRLPVEIDVELARIPLSLGTLSSLKPGSILPLHVRHGESVLLRIGERAVARAELVDLEGEMGARVLALLSE